MKKLFSVALIVFMLTQVLLLPAAAQEYIVGDLNCDNQIDVRDSQLLFGYSMMPDLYPLDGYSGSVDFIRDGNIDLQDAIKLFYHSMLPELYPLG